MEDRKLQKQLRKAGLKVDSTDSKIVEVLAKSILEDIDSKILRDLESMKTNDVFGLLPAL